MDFIVENGVVYQVQSVPVNVEEEEKKLQWMKDCVAQDEAAIAEYNAKLEEIENSDLDEKVKHEVKKGVMLFASGVSKSEMERQEERVAEIKKLLKK